MKSKWLLRLLFSVLALQAAGAQSQSASPKVDPKQAPTHLTVTAGPEEALVVPRLSHAPTLEDFLSMAPEGSAAQEMTRITHFIQREPHDGEPVSQPTESYLGYDEKNLYIVFVCHDDPSKVRAHLTRRKAYVGYDDDVAVMLDTFHDRRRAYEFQVNPIGIQWDAIWTEASYADTGGNFDTSFETLWYSKGKLTSQGYVVWIAIPFRSLRFPAAKDQTWGLIMLRDITRDNETAFWPRVSINQEGRLGQAAVAQGMTGVSPGRNIQLIPYGLLNSFHAIDDRGPFPTCAGDMGAGCARYQNRDIGGTVGLDSKFILGDRLVIDATANPDFSQVESDDPQVTVNQRYRVYFPEKRPFFIENGDYFRTPIDLFFTRNIVDPDAGIRLTGKAGPYSLGFMSADDRAPGLTISPDDPLFKERSYFNIARVSRDIFKQSSIGAIFTDWEFPAANSYNRVGGIDTRLKLSKQLIATGQAVVSSTNCSEQYADTYFTCAAGYSAGPAYKADLTYTSRHWYSDHTYNDVSQGFLSVPGFVNRLDIREYREDTQYLFRPKSGPVLSWGPEFIGHWTWDHTGLRLDTDYIPSFSINMKRQTKIYFTPYEEFRERLRPKDYPNILTQNQDYHEHNSSVTVSTAPTSQVTLGAFYQWGDDINFVPNFFTKPPGTPFLAHSDTAEAIATIHPLTQLRIDNTYLFSRLRTIDDGVRTANQNIFNNHIIRTKWNWQFTRELSLRVILQYNSTLTRNSPSLSAAEYPLTYLPTTRQFNTDVLVTYLLHPGTAIYVGYNTDQQNFDRSLAIDPFLGGVHYTNRMMNDGRLFFVKVSYLLRF